MDSTEEDLWINPKTSQIIIFASITVNVCVLLNVFTPSLCRYLARKVFKKIEKDASSEDGIPGIFGRICTSAPFLFAFPIGGFILLGTSGVLRDPFFAFTSAMRITFSIAIGHYIYKCAEVLAWRREIQYKPLLVHHLVTVSLLTVINIYEQNAMLGVVALFLKTHLIFAEFDNDSISKVLQVHVPSKVCKASTIAAFVVAVVLNGLVPVSLLCAAVVTSSHKLLQMDQVPLAFFFLSFVFLFAVAAWFFNDAIKALKNVLSRKKFKSILRDTKARPLTSVVNHNGLEKLYEAANGSAVLHITCNDLWDRDLSQLCSGPLENEKVKNSDFVDIEFQTPAVLKNTNII